MKPNALLALLSDRRIHSGESLAKELGVSRTAVWKQIKRAVSEGLEVKTIRGQGYQLVSTLDLLDRDRILAALPEECRKLVALTTLSEVGSTNAEVARQLVSANGLVPIVLADAQTAGRGRRGRNWSSPRGENLYLSLGLTFRGGFEVLDGLSLVLGVAVARALQSLGADDVGLKWPNDLFARGQKFGGILVEIQGELQEGQVQVIAGIGINVHMKEAPGIDQPWTSLAGTWPGRAWVRNDLAAAIIGEIVSIVNVFESGGFEAFRAEWQARDIFFGQPLVAREGTLAGRGAGVDNTGNYQLETEAGLVSVRAGDISLRVVP